MTLEAVDAALGACLEAGSDRIFVMEDLTPADNSSIVILVAQCRKRSSGSSVQPTEPFR